MTSLRLEPANSRLVAERLSHVYVHTNTRPDVSPLVRQANAFLEGF
jgi:hypothetical protein